MAGRFVRSSKYRHVFGRSTRKEQCYDNVKVSRNAWDSNLVKANPEYISVNWDASGGGAFAVIPVEERGRLPDRIPLFRGHTAVVLDTDWNPFNDSLLASGSDDGKVFLWRVPDGFSLHTDLPADEVQDIAPVGKLAGHPKKVGHVLFNPAAENVVASSSGDFTVKLWDIEAGASKLTLKVGEVIQSLSWSANGSLLVTTSRDKKLRIWDTRQEKAVQEVTGHTGGKNSRAVWMGEHDRIATTGFSRMSDRQLALWDIKAPNQPVGGFQMLDSISGVCVPFWDDGTQCLYLAGKGDGNIRYYEYENDKFEYLSEYKSSEPQRGIAFLPKRGVNMHENEVMRAYKTVNDSYIEPISFLVPRRAESFQEDLYPPTVGLKPAMSSKEWLGGADAMPPKVSMESLYDGNGLKEVPASDIKPVVKAAEPAKSAEPAPQQAKEEPVLIQPPQAAKSIAPVSMEHMRGGVAIMAEKYADEESDDDDASSFEEVPNPVEPATKSIPPQLVKEDVSSATPALPQIAEKAEDKDDVNSVPTIAALQSEKISTDTSADKPATVKSALGNESALEHEITNLKDVLAEQTAQIKMLSAAVADLVAEVKRLKS